ncbi:MAG: hypothetical protein LBJ15_18350 [Comamonas sp.]|jgi:hypothetical protein|uniref:hypothetical protein n=1 Tax=Comamonas sp. TaxID=34028 RepID=UPI0028271AFB|nr:hypothetical protein [Comamonas sp.]MDR0215939.1 hypothetical protein [Comamonas sp.]
MKALPITYHLEISQDSLRNDPVVSLESSTPFQTFAVGDKLAWAGFSDAAWYPEPRNGQLLRITDVLHYMWDIPESNIGHKIRLCVELCEIDD